MIDTEKTIAECERLRQWCEETPWNMPPTLDAYLRALLALLPYARHHRDCRWWHDPNDGCDCGYQQALATLPEIE